MKSAVTTVVTIILLSLLASLAAATSPDYYLNHPDPKVRQEYMDKLMGDAQKKKNENYERKFRDSQIEKNYWFTMEMKHGTKDREEIKRLENIEKYGTNDPDEIKQIQDERIAQILKEAGERDRRNARNEMIKKVVLLGGMFLALMWFYRWLWKAHRQQKAVAEAAAAKQAKADKIARRKLEKEKILAGESVKK